MKYKLIFSAFLIPLITGCASLTLFYPKANNLKYGEVNIVKEYCLSQDYDRVKVDMQRSGKANETTNINCTSYSPYSVDCTSKANNYDDFYNSGAAIGAALANASAKKDALVKCMNTHGYTTNKRLSSFYRIRSTKVDEVFKSDIYSDASYLLSVADMLYAGAGLMQDLESAYMLYLAYASISRNKLREQADIVEKDLGAKKILSIQDNIKDLSLSQIVSRVEERLNLQEARMRKEKEKEKENSYQHMRNSSTLGF